MARRYTIESVQLGKQHTRCTLILTVAGRQAGNERGRVDGGREEASGGGREGGTEGMERGSDDARQGESVGGGR